MYFIKKSLSSVIVLTTFLLTTGTFAMIPDKDGTGNNVTNPSKKRLRIQVDEHGKKVNVLETLGNLSDDNKKQIFISAASNTPPGNLRLVCQDWRNIIDLGTVLDKDDNYSHPSFFWNNTLNDTYYYAPIFNGVLVYRPIPENDEGMKTFKFSDLQNPLKYTFDLSGCTSSVFGKAEQRLVITTDIITFFRSTEEDKNKLFILITTRAWVNRNIASLAKPFCRIMARWPARVPVGLFWRCGEEKRLNRYDYLTTKSAANISSKDLFENWADRDQPTVNIRMLDTETRSFHLQL